MKGDCEPRKVEDTYENIARQIDKFVKAKKYSSPDEGGPECVSFWFNSFATCVKKKNVFPMLACDEKLINFMVKALLRVDEYEA